MGGSQNKIAHPPTSFFPSELLHRRATSNTLGGPGATWFFPLARVAGNSNRAAHRCAESKGSSVVRLVREQVRRDTTEYSAWFGLDEVHKKVRLGSVGFVWFVCSLHNLPP